MIAAFRRWRLRAAQEALADAEHYLSHWIRPFPGRSPSEEARAERKIEKLQKRAARWAVLADTGSSE